MKFKQLAVLGLAVALTFSLAGCQQTGTVTDNSNQVVLTDTHGTLSEAVKAKIKEKPEIGELSKLLKDGLASAKAEDADSAVLLYVRYADSMASELASKMIYTTPEFSEKFNTVFSQEFNASWDEAKINSIADQEVKAVFNQLNDAYFKVDSYGDYFGPVVNYQKIAELPGISDTVKGYYRNVSSLYSLSRLASQLQGLDYMATAQYSAAMEDIYNNAKDITLKEGAESMLRFSLNLYYTGSETSSPFDFEKNVLKEAFVSNTKEVIKKYPKYHVGLLGQEFLDLSDKNNGQLSTDFADIVINYKKFGFNSNLTVTSNKIIKEPNYFEIIPVFSGFKDASVTEKIASEIETTVGSIKEVVQWDKSENTNYHLSYLVDFANEKYLSLQLSGVSYNQENSTNLYDNECLLFDVQTGEKITLKDIFKDDYDVNMKRIKELVLKDIVEKQQLSYKTTKDIVIEDNVLIDQNYMMVILKKGAYSDEQQYDIVSYVTYSDLLDTFDMNSYLR